MNFKKTKTKQNPETTKMHCQSSIFELVPSYFGRIKIFYCFFNILELWYYLALYSTLLVNETLTVEEFNKIPLLLITEQEVI